MPDFSFEQQHQGFVAGIDEAGRGPWAGPVVAAAVILDATRASPALLGGLNDSKKLSAKKREALFELLQTAEQNSTAFIGWCRIDAPEIDKINILQATFKAMTAAVQSLPVKPAHVLIDGNKVPPQLGFPATAIIKGDSISASIAAASIIAKVTRDRIMADIARDYPAYGWHKNAGYGTKAHVAAMDVYGITKHHRASYKPVRDRLENGAPLLP